MIRQSLIQIFTWKRCSEAESLADETLDRVMSKVPELRKIYVGDPSAYIHRVAKLVLAEHARGRSVERDRAPENLTTTDIGAEKMSGCLERCLSNLSPYSRDLILNYYSEDKPKKVSQRKDLAQKLDISATQLRLRMYKIRKTLEECMQACMGHEG